MIRLFNAYFPKRTLLLTLTEAILVALGFLLAVVLWAGTAADANIYLIYENGVGRIGIVVAVFVVLMYYFDLYDTIIIRNRREVATRLVGVLGCTFVALAVLYYTFPDMSLGGSALWTGVIIVTIAVPAWRGVFFAVSTSERFAERAIIFGDGPLAEVLIEEIGRRPELGMRVVGFVGDQVQAASIRTVEIEELDQVVKRQGVHRIIVTM